MIAPSLLAAALLLQPAPQLPVVTLQQALKEARQKNLQAQQAAEPKFTRYFPISYAGRSDDGKSVYYSRIGSHSGLWRHDLRSSTSVQIRTWAEVDAFDIRGGRLVFARVASDTHIFRLPVK